MQLRILQTDAVEWLTRPEMAAALGVTERTVTRMVDRGQVERRETARGNLYRLAGESSQADDATGQDRTVGTAIGTGQDKARDETGRRPGREQVTALVDVVAGLVATNQALTLEVRRLQDRIDELEGRRPLARLLHALARLVD